MIRSRRQLGKLMALVILVCVLSLPPSASGLGPNTDRSSSPDSDQGLDHSTVIASDQASNVLVSTPSQGLNPSLDQAPTVSIYLDDEPLQFDIPPTVINGSTMVPMRAVFEAFGASIEWDHAHKTVTATQSGLELTYTIGEPHAEMNGERFQFRSEPGRIIEGRTLVPLRFVGESLGAYVEYEPQTRTVFIERNIDVGSLSKRNRYRMTLPYHTLLDHAPAWIRYMREHADDDSYVFFGDSQTWGAHLGRMEAHPYRLQRLLQTDTFNMGVPGFTDGHLLEYIPFVMQDTVEPRVVIQLQLFWGGEARSYTGLPALLDAALPDVETALQHVYADLPNDEEVADPPTAYFDLETEVKQERIDRGKELFAAERPLDPLFMERLNELKRWMESRPQQQFYVYVPPYLTSEIYRHTTLTEQDWNQRIDAIASLFADSGNIHFRDFNHNDEWADDSFADWWHRTAQGEKRFAERMAAWLLEQNE